MDGKDRLRLLYDLRQPDKPHRNCCQCILLVFRRELGYEEKTLLDISAHLGGGLHLGTACGAVLGAHLTMGMLGCDEQTVERFDAWFQNSYTHINCADLRRGLPPEDRSHCDEIIDGTVLALHRLLSGIGAEAAFPLG